MSSTLIHLKLNDTGIFSEPDKLHFIVDEFKQIQSATASRLCQ